MIVGNKFLPNNKTISAISSGILEYLKVIEKTTVIEIMTKKDLAFDQTLICLEFLYSIGEIDYIGGEICLKK